MYNYFLIEREEKGGHKIKKYFEFFDDSHQTNMGEH
jgi:hypothetical protein